MDIWRVFVQSDAVHSGGVSQCLRLHSCSCCSRKVCQNRKLSILIRFEEINRTF